MKIYILTEEESDYFNVIAAFSKQEDADYASQASILSNVYEFELDEWQRPLNKFPYHVIIKRGGDIWSVRKVCLGSFQESAIHPKNSWWNESRLDSYYWAESPEEAEKMARQDRVSRIESGEWKE